MSGAPAYTFGDNQPASRRLAVVDGVFSRISDSLLADVMTLLGTPPTSVTDLGCGPGYTTSRLARWFPSAQITGIDQSRPFLAEARDRVGGERCRFEVGDITAPLNGPADVMYARFLLSHLPDVPAVVTHWCQGLASGGVLILEEPDHILSDDADFAAYLSLTSATVASTGADLYAGAVLATAADPLGMQRVIDRVVDPELTAAQAASMFVPNLESLGLERTEVAALHARLRRRLADPTPGLFCWGHRQVVLRVTAEAAPP